MNKQREAVYGLRRQLLEGVDQKELILEDYVSGILGDLMDQFAAVKVHPEDWDLKGMKDAIFTRFGVDIYAEGLKPEHMNRQELGDAIHAEIDRIKKEDISDEELKMIKTRATRRISPLVTLSMRSTERNSSRQSP